MSKTDKYQRSTLALRLENVFSEKAKQNQGSRFDLTDDICHNCDESYSQIDTKKELAKIADVSHNTIARVKKIEQSAIKS